MDDVKNSVAKHETDSQTVAGSVATDVKVSSRRRLLRQGASVVAVTLASRPVLAWHCKSPSAWGSELINPNTSLAANAGHKSYTDETWTITNWVGNSSRNNFGQPWAKLKAAYPSLYDASTKTNNAFDYTKVTVLKLFSSVPNVVRPAGLLDTAKVKDVLTVGSDFQKYLIVAQLNYILLAPLLSPNDLDMCLSLADLQQMAKGSYSPQNMPGVVWGPAQIKDYLYNNWIVRP